MKFKEGPNLIHSEQGVKLFADVRNGEVTGWHASDKNGKPVKVEIKHDEKGGAGKADEAKCFACWIYYTPDGGVTRMCYEIDCKTAPKK